LREADRVVKAIPGGGRRKRARSPGQEKPAVDAEVRRHLVEVCAFFHADHFRPAQPGCYRQQDLAEAAAEIDAVLKRRARRGKTTKR